jgi:DNA-binding response OmpR family regulator
VVLDLSLPIKNGLDVCRDLRSKGDAVPVLMLTARDAVEDRIVGLDAGADDYLTKPFHFGELLARVRALARRRGLPSYPSVSCVDGSPSTPGRTRSGSMIGRSASVLRVLAVQAFDAGSAVANERTEHWSPHRLTLRPPETEFDRGLRRFGRLLTSAILFMVFLVFIVHVLGAVGRRAEAQGRP